MLIVPQSVACTKKEAERIRTCNYFNPIYIEGRQIYPTLSYFIIASKLKKYFALMRHPEFESNLITHIFRKFGVSRTTESRVIFALSEAPEEFYAVLSTMHDYQCAYSIHCTAYSLSMLIFCCNKIFYLLINALHHHYVIDDIIIQKYCFFCCLSK